MVRSPRPARQQRDHASLTDDPSSFDDVRVDHTLRIALAASLSLLAACGSDPGRCVTGATQACVCTDGRAGAQSCLSSGTWGMCACTGTMDDAAVSAMVDAASTSPDAAPMVGTIELVSSSPADGATGVSVDDTLVFTFDTALDAARITDDAVIVMADRPIGQGTDLRLHGSVTASGTTLAFVGPWTEYGTHYTARLDPTLIRGAGGETPGSTVSRTVGFDLVFVDTDYYYDIHSMLEDRTSHFYWTGSALEFGRGATIEDQWFWSFTPQPDGRWALANVMVDGRYLYARNVGDRVDFAMALASGAAPTQQWYFEPAAPRADQRPSESATGFVVRNAQLGTSGFMYRECDGCTAAFMRSNPPYDTTTAEAWFWLSRARHTPP